MLLRAAHIAATPPRSAAWYLFPTYKYQHRLLRDMCDEVADRGVVMEQAAHIQHPRASAGSAPRSAADAAPCTASLATQPRAPSGRLCANRCGYVATHSHARVFNTDV